jgi:hypothetical protein
MRLAHSAASAIFLSVKIRAIRGRSGFDLVAAEAQRNATISNVRERRMKPRMALMKRASSRDVVGSFRRLGSTVFDPEAQTRRELAEVRHILISRIRAIRGRSGF